MRCATRWIYIHLTAYLAHSIASWQWHGPTPEFKSHTNMEMVILRPPRSVRSPPMRPRSPNFPGKSAYHPHGLIGATDPSPRPRKTQINLNFTDKCQQNLIPYSRTLHPECVQLIRLWESFVAYNCTCIAKAYNEIREHSVGTERQTKVSSGAEHA